MALQFQTAHFRFSDGPNTYLVSYAPHPDQQYKGWMICRVTDMNQNKEILAIRTQAAANKSNALGYIKKALKS